MHAAQPLLRLAPVEKWVNVGIASREKNPIQTLDDCLYVRGVRDERYVHRRTAERLDRLAVITREVKPLGLKLDAHRYPYRWPSLFHLFSYPCRLPYHNSKFLHCP